MGKTDKPIMVGRKRAAELFDISAGTLGNLLSQRKGPRAYKFGAKVLYKISDLEDFFSSTPIITSDTVRDESDR